jgi:hypothetical protein
LRQPNRKWKVSRPVLKDRLRIEWLNTFRVRKLATLALGYDPIMEDFDQSPFHVNESGSRGRGTLHLRGCATVPLKECHAATRERWIANTMTTSSAARAMRIPPLEVMFRAEGGGKVMLPALRETIPSWAPWLTVVGSPSGSYAEADVLNYMERHLEPMTPGRDWRILLVDSYKAQLTDPVRRLAWHRGYVLVVHGGGATGVMQPNDTDLHRELKQQYCNLESAEFVEQQRLRPRGVPLTRKSDAVAWIAAVWAQPELHLSAVAGYKKVGLTNALTGEEDNLICREAREFWDELHMARLRQEVVQTVEVEFAAGRLQWNFEDVSNLVLPFPRVGGAADFQPDDDGSESDDSRGESDGDSDGPSGPAVAGQQPEDHADAGDNAEEGTLTVPCQSIVPLDAPVLTQSEAGDAHAHQYNLDVLQAVSDQLRRVGQDRLLVAVDAAIHAERRRAQGRGQTNPAIARALIQNQELNLTRVLDGRSLMMRMDEEAKRRRLSLAELRKQQERLEQQQVALQQASTVVECFNALKSFDAGDFGQGHPHGGTREHKRTRLHVLERLRAKSPPLPADLANDWEWFKKNWDDARLRNMHPTRRGSWGSQFRDMIMELMARTRSGEPDVLAKWMVQECRRYLAMPELRI